MSWGIGDVFDLIRAGGGYQRDDGQGAAVGKVSASAVLDVEEKVWNGYNDVPGRSFFSLVGAEGICTTKGRCQLGVEAGLGFVPGILGAFAGPKLGIDHDFDNGHNKPYLAAEFDALDPASHVTEMWALEGRVTMDANDGSVGFMVFLNVSGSIALAVKHNN
jgi:hypothetical protein